MILNYLILITNIIMEIMKYNVLTTPVLVVNEEIKVKGRVPSKEEVIQLLTQ